MTSNQGGQPPQGQPPQVPPWYWQPQPPPQGYPGQSWYPPPGPQYAGPRQVVTRTVMSGGETAFHMVMIFLTCGLWLPVYLVRRPRPNPAPPLRSHPKREPRHRPTGRPGPRLATGHVAALPSRALLAGRAGFPHARRLVSAPVQPLPLAPLIRGVTPGCPKPSVPASRPAAGKPGA